MAFPVGWPDFTREQRQRLKRLEVLDEQVDELRHTLLESTHTPAQRPTLTEVRGVVTGVATHAHELAKALDGIATRAGTAKSVVLDLLGTENTDGLRHLAHELSALALAAQQGVKKLGHSPTRHRSPRTNAIRAIDEALTRGWTRANGQHRTRHLYRADGSIDSAEVERAKVAKNVPHMRQYQPKLWPSESENRPFHEIVEICLAAAGVPAEPSSKLAIRTYLKSSLAQRTKLAAALWPEATLKGTSRRR